jgi:hypothetical protein
MRSSPLTEGHGHGERARKKQTNHRAAFPLLRPKRSDEFAKNTRIGKCLHRQIPAFRENSSSRSRHWDIADSPGVSWRAADLLLVNRLGEHVHNSLCAAQYSLDFRGAWAHMRNAAVQHDALAARQWRQVRIKAFRVNALSPFRCDQAGTSTWPQRHTRPPMKRWSKS